MPQCTLEWPDDALFGVIITKPYTKDMKCSRKGVKSCNRKIVEGLTLSLSLSLSLGIGDYAQENSMKSLRFCSLPLNSGSQPGVILPIGTIWQHLGTFFVVIIWGTVLQASRGQMTKHTIMLRTAPHNKGLYSSNVNNAKDKKSCLRLRIATLYILIYFPLWFNSQLICIVCSAHIVLCIQRFGR